MMKIKDIIQSGLQDLKSQKKKNRVSMILIFIALAVYIGINSHINSLRDSMNASIDFFESRILIDGSDEQQAEENLNIIRELYGDDERVVEIVKATPARVVQWIEADDILYVDSAPMEVFGCYEAVFDYDYKGERRVPGDGEIILPRYLCDIGVYDSKNLGDGDALIGETIKVRYEAYIDSFSEEYEFKVIGTYDNIMSRSNGCTALVSFDMLNHIQDIQNDVTDCVNEELPEEEKSDRNIYYTMYIAEGYDIDAFAEEVYAATDERIYMVRNRMLTGTVEGYFQYVIMVGNIVSVMLLLVAVINIIISSINEVKDRKWEFALKLSMGYSRSDIVRIYFVEKLANLIKALLLAVFVVGMYSIAMTFITQNYLEYWKREYIYTLYPVNVIVAVILVIIAGLIGTVVARGIIKDIDVAKELKSEN